MSSKFSWIQQKMCEIQIFWQFFTSRYVYKWKSYESSTLAHYLKKEYSHLDKFSFEITRNHLVARQPLKLLTQLLRDWEAANLKLTNQMVMQAWKTKQTAEEMWQFLWLLLICLSWKNNVHFRPIFEPPLRSN